MKCAGNWQAEIQEARRLRCLMSSYRYGSFRYKEASKRYWEVMVKYNLSPLEVDQLELFPDERT